jgi:phosphoglycolate phosphatase
MTLILFDYDGVLADTLGIMLQFGQEVCDELGVFHTVTKDDLNSLEVMSFVEFGRKCEVPEPLVNEFVRRWFKRFDEKKSVPAIFIGLEEAVKKLSANNTIVIITGNTTQNVKDFLIEHRLDEHIHAIYGLDLPGSKAEKISLAQNQFAADAKHEAVFMVGDSASDVRAAKEAAVKSIAVSWGHQNIEILTRAKPDHIVHSAKELMEVFNHQQR